MQFKVTAQSAGSLDAVSVDGELDHSTAGELRSALASVLDEGSGSVLVDFSDCTFIDSTGLSLLVEAKRRLSEEQRSFGVCCAPADLKRLLEMTGIDEAVGLFETRDEAISALNGARDSG